MLTIQFKYLILFIFAYLQFFIIGKCEVELIFHIVLISAHRLVIYEKCVNIRNAPDVQLVMESDLYLFRKHMCVLKLE